jgi:hypothetical protein
MGFSVTWRGDHASELDYRAVANAPDDVSVVHGAESIDEVASERPQPG